MRRTRNRRNRRNGGGLFGGDEEPAAPAAPAAPIKNNNDGFFAGIANLFNKNKSPANAAASANQPPVQTPPPVQSPPPSATGGKRKNKCGGIMGGSYFVGAPVGYDSVRASGGQPSERIMQHATTAGGRRKRRTRRTRRTRRKHRTHRNKSHRHRKN